MGQSTDAYLVYGIQDESGDNDGSWEISVNGRAVLASSEVDNLLEERFDCGLLSHCSCEYPMWILHPLSEDMKFIAKRGNPTMIEKLPIPSFKDIAGLQDAAKFLGWEGEPGWFLASDWC